MKMRLLGIAVCSLVFCFVKSDDDDVPCKTKASNTNASPCSSSSWKHLPKAMGKFVTHVEKLEAQIKGLVTQNKYMKQDIKRLTSSLDVCCKGGKTTKAGPVISKGPSLNLTIDVDDAIELFLDGTRVGNFQHGTQWRTADVAVLPLTTKIIAVKGINTYGDPGVLGSTDDGYVLTNTSWKCTNQQSEGWTTAGFDDSDWPPAHVVLPYSQKPIAGIREDADWIWTKNYNFKTGDRVVYCRRKL